MCKSYIDKKTKERHKRINESQRIHDNALLLINIRKDSVGDQSKILSPNLLVLLCTSFLVSSLSPYQQYQEVYRVEIWNRRTVTMHKNNIIETSQISFV